VTKLICHQTSDQWHWYIIHHDGKISGWRISLAIACWKFLIQQRRNTGNNPLNEPSYFNNSHKDAKRMHRHNWESWNHVKLIGITTIGKKKYIFGVTMSSITTICKYCSVWTRKNMDTRGSSNTWAAASMMVLRITFPSNPYQWPQWPLNTVITHVLNNKF
jgi:hypothetical protein